MTDVEDADWTPDGESMAVARVTPEGYALEFPFGTVLHETDGWISHTRISPDGTRVAFIDHPVSGDDLGDVCVIGADGAKRTLSPDWASVTGLAWSADGREIWFTGSEIGANTSLYAVDLSGRQRVVMTSPGLVIIHDISSDGRVLLAHGKFASACGITGRWMARNVICRGSEPPSRRDCRPTAACSCSLKKEQEPAAARTRCSSGRWTARPLSDSAMRCWPPSPPTAITSS